MTAAGAGLPGPQNSLIDVAGIRVGHHTAVGDGYLTGTTVVLAPAGGHGRRGRRPRRRTGHPRDRPARTRPPPSNGSTRWC